MIKQKILKQKIVILGGGAAGIMSAITAKKEKPESEVILIEHNLSFGKKVLVCGAGRCNLTNKTITPDNYYGAPKTFISSVIEQFDGVSIQKFFNELGVEQYVETKNGKTKGKVFPITNQANTVTELLVNELEMLGVISKLEYEIIDVLKTDKFTVKCKHNDLEIDFEADKIIVALGGMTYPILGATATGYKIAEKFGHTIIKPIPSALPLEVKDSLVPKLFGQRLLVEVKSIIDNKQIKSDIEEVMFTKYGLSGPAILNISREISVKLNRENDPKCKVVINFFPGVNKEVVNKKFQEHWQAKPTQKVLYSLYGKLTNKVAQKVLEHLEIECNKQNRDLTKNEKIRLINFLTNWELNVKGTKGWEEAEFTAGGINTEEINPKTLESKIVKNLYFAGEIINVDGDVGGFNLSWAWSSGFVAGRSIVQNI